MAWHPAPSVKAALNEATRRWPHRHTGSDGIIGDARHQAEPTSDHNPDAHGVVHAFDLTQDPAHGVDCGHLAELIRARQDHRVRYLIWNRRICPGPWSDGVRAGKLRPWVWQPYGGLDPHTGHLHVSVGYSASAENDTSAWFEPPAPAVKAAVVRKDAAFPIPFTHVFGPDSGRKASWHDGENPTDKAYVMAIQRVVGVAADGHYGPSTKAAVRTWQQRHGMNRADGYVGADDWARMF